MKKLLILGAGGYGRTVYELAQTLGCYEKIAFLDDRKSEKNVLGGCDEYPMFCDDETAVYPAFGNNEIRMRWLDQLMDEGIPVPAMIHPSAYVSPSAKIGTGTVVLTRAVVSTTTRLGNGCLINIGALVDHDCVLEDGVHLAPGAIVKANNHLPAGLKVESGEVVGNRVYPL